MRRSCLSTHTHTTNERSECMRKEKALEWFIANNLSFIVIREYWWNSSEKKNVLQNVRTSFCKHQKEREREKNGSYEVARKKRACENCEHYIRNAIASPIWHRWRSLVSPLVLSNQNAARYILISLWNVVTVLLQQLLLLLLLCVFQLMASAGFVIRVTHKMLTKYNENMCGKLLFASRGISLRYFFSFFSVRSVGSFSSFPFLHPSFAFFSMMESPVLVSLLFFVN